MMRLDEFVEFLVLCSLVNRVDSSCSHCRDLGVQPAGGGSTAHFRLGVQPGGGFNRSFSARGSTRAPLGGGFNHLGVQPGGGFNQSFDNSGPVQLISSCICGFKSHQKS